LDVGANLNVFADGDSGDVESDESPVDEGACANGGLVAVVAAERRADDNFGADAAEEFSQDSIAAGVIVAGRGIELRGEYCGAITLATEIQIVGDIVIADKHPLAIRAAVGLESGVGQWWGRRFSRREVRLGYEWASFRRGHERAAAGSQHDDARPLSQSQQADIELTRRLS
jgi:hypothetical protein